MSRLVHITMFDNRGVASYAIRVPYHAGFVESLKVVILPAKRAWKSVMMAWVVDISEIKRLYKLLQVTFFEEEFCPFCWQKKPCVEWQMDIPRTEGTILSWPSSNPKPPPIEPEPQAAPKRAKKAPKTPRNPSEPKKPRKPRESKKKQPEPPPVSRAEPAPEPPPAVPPPRTTPPPDVPPLRRTPPPRTSSVPPPNPTVVDKALGIRAAEMLLGVKYPYTVSDVKSAFRKKSLIAHPDRPGGSTESFILLQEANDLLLKVLEVLR